MKRLLEVSIYTVALLCLISVPCPAQQKESDHQNKELANSAVKSLSTYFSKIHSIAFKSSLRYWADSSDATPSVQFALRGPQEGTFEMERNGNKFRIDDRSQMGPEGEQNRKLVTYDGDKYQIYSYYDHYLWIKTVPSEKEQPSQAEFRNANFFMTVFEFCSEALKVNGDLSALNITELQNPQCWASLDKRIVAVEPRATAGGDFTVEFQGGKEIWSGSPTTYKVTFSTKDGFFPISWKRLDQKKNILFSVDVTEMGLCTDPSGAVFPYPKKMVYSGYGVVSEPGKPYKNIQKKPFFSVFTEMTAFSINGPPSSEDTFTIDPATADIIKDVDHDVYITVPR